MNILDTLMHSTVRLEVKKTNGSTSFGTGFTYWVKNPHNPGYGEPTIVTNAHILKDACEVSFHMKHKDKLNPKNTALRPGISLRLRFQDTTDIIFHPEVDLAMFPLSNALDEYSKHFGDSYKENLTYLPESLIPSQEFLENLNPVEDLLMIGYPSALWDSVRNLPIFRSGKTASHPAYPFNGQKYFLTDLPVFEGSSGSPVFLFNFGTPFFDRQQNAFVFDSRIKLLGINSQVKTMPTKAIATLPTGHSIQLDTIDRMDLGVAIFSSEVRILEDKLREGFLVP